MKSDNVRVESAVSAAASGNLTWGLWPHECTVALGISGRHNPLGFYVVRYLSDTPSAAGVYGVVLVLAKEMQRRGVSAEGINDVAFKAFDFWRDSRCPACAGRGVTGIEQGQCNKCAGTGQQPDPVGSDAISIGLECLREAEQMMEGQLAARLRRG